MYKWILMAVVVVGVGLLVQARAEEPAAPAAPPTVEERLAALEAKFAALESADIAPDATPEVLRKQLAIALSKINELERKVRVLEGQVATEAIEKTGADKAPKEAKADPSAFLIGGSRWSSPKGGSIFTVTKRDGNSVTLTRPSTSTNGGGTINVEMTIKDSKLLVNRVYYEGPNQRSDKVQGGGGSIRGKSLKLSYSVLLNNNSTWSEDLDLRLME
jgi:hypothetical protein